MKKFTFLFGLTYLLFSVHFLSAQNNFYPTARDRWNITTFEVKNNTEYAHTDDYRTEAITRRFCGKRYLSLIKNNQLLGYYREEGTRLWGRKTSDCSEKDSLLFDFNMNPGDTVKLFRGKLPTEPDVFAICDTVLTKKDKKTVKFQTLYQLFPDGKLLHSAPWSKWVQGIGSLEQTFYYFDDDYRQNVGRINGNFHFLTCFNDSLQLIFTLTPHKKIPYKGDSCRYHYEIKPTSVDLFSEHRSLLIPNPFDEGQNIYIDHLTAQNFKTYRLINLNGKTLTEGILTEGAFNPFPNPTPEGIYFLILQSENLQTFKIWKR